MTLEARVTPIWKKQKLFVALFMMAFGGYFFWDGAVGWPRSNERFRKFEELQHDPEAWAAYAKQRGWTTKKPEKIHTEKDIQGQFVFGSLFSLIGVITLVYWAQQVRRRLKMDDESVTSPAGTRVPFSSVTGLGLKRWESKGFATVRYELNGRKGEFLVDDYKFETEPAHKIVDEIKRRLEERAAGSASVSTDSAPSVNPT